jgi:hypothetical protein
MTTLLHEPEAQPNVSTAAVAWIDDQEALVARMGPEGRISTCGIVRGDEPEGDFLAQVVRAIGDRERVVLLGPDAERLELEREYVLVYRRPDRLVDVEPAGRVDPEALVARLRELAG